MTAAAISNPPLADLPALSALIKDREDLLRLHQVFARKPDLSSNSDQSGRRRLGVLLSAVLLHDRDQVKTFNRVYKAWFNGQQETLRHLEKAKSAVRSPDTDSLALFPEQGKTWLPPSLPPVPTRYLEHEQKETLVWGIDQYIAEESTSKLDLAGTVQATARGGGIIELVYEQARYHSEVWLWQDAAVQDPALNLLGTEIYAYFQGGRTETVTKALRILAPRDRDQGMWVPLPWRWEELAPAEQVMLTEMGIAGGGTAASLRKPGSYLLTLALSVGLTIGMLGLTLQHPLSRPVLELSRIPAGSFLMGSPEDEPERNPDADDAVIRSGGEQLSVG